VKELKGFEKVAIKAGGSETVTFNLGSEELGFFNNDGEYLVEPGEFDVMVGPNCMDTQGGSFTLK
jgi:beta-glucosidase